MKILISSLASDGTDREATVGELNFEREKGNFWMRCVMGDDWFQRVNSCARLEFIPKIVRPFGDTLFVVFESDDQARQFHAWLQYAEEQVQQGYRTMRG